MGKPKKHGGHQSASDLQRMAQRAMEKQDFKEALKNAKVCYRLDGSHENRQVLERAWLARGMQLASAGFAAEARAAAQELLSLGVAEADVRQGLPDLLIAVGLYDQAVTSGKLTGSADDADPVLLAKAADRAVADPATAPATLAGIREGAAAVRAALDAIYANDEAAAQSALADVPRQSPFAEWKFFVRGLAAYYRHDTEAMRANWDRLAPDRFAARLASSLRRLSDSDAPAGDRAEFRAALRTLEKDMFGENVIWSLESLQKSIAAGRWREAVSGLRRWKTDFQTAMPGLAERIERFFYDMAVRKASHHWLDDLAGVIEPPWWDPRWNRARAMICEQDEKSPIQMADDYWLAYVEDLSSISELKPAEQALAQAMIWEHLGVDCVDAVEEEEDGYKDDSPYFEDELYEQRSANEVESLKARALECFNKAIELAPTYASAHHHLAKAHDQWEQEESAAAAYRRLLAHVPDDYEAIMALLKHHRSREEGPAERDYALQARRLKPASKEVLNTVAAARFSAARTLAAEGRFDEARAELSAIEADGIPTAVPDYDLSVARAMIEFKAGRTDDGRRLAERATAQADDPADACMLLAIEAVRQDLPFQLNDLADVFRKEWEASMKKRRSRAAGSMSRRMLALMNDFMEFRGKHDYVNGFLNRLIEYVGGCSRIRWQADDLLDACRFLRRVCDDPQYRSTRKPLAKFLDSGRKKFPHEPSFHMMRGEMEFRRGPFACDRRLARQCYQMAMETAKTSLRADAKSIHEEAASQLRFLERRRDPPPLRSRFAPDGDFDGIPPEVFDAVPSEQLLEAVQRMSEALGLDPDKMINEITARLGGRGEGNFGGTANRATATERAL